MGDSAQTAASAEFSNSNNHGLQMGQNYGSMEASFYSDSIQQVTIAAGASVYMGEKKSIEDKLLDALIAADPSDRHDVARADPGTCEWIFENEAFRSWIQTNPPTTSPLYIQGIPGSGKTVLLKFLVKVIQASQRTSGGVSPAPVTPGLSEEMVLAPELGVIGRTIAVGCFCDDKNERRRAPVWILRTLLHRMLLVNRNLVKYVLQHVQSPEDLGEKGGFGPDAEEFQSIDVLQRILEDIAVDPELEVLYFVIDGLDQCGPHMAAVVRLIEELSTRLSRKAQSAGTEFTFRCILSDRGSKIVSDKMSPEFTVIMPEGNQRDIGEVADRRVRGIQEYRNFSEGLREDITAQLKESSKGMFMWLSLVLDDLATWEGVWTEARVKERLHNIPPDVEAFYSAILERQARDMIGRLKTLLMWVYLACRPLTLTELDVILNLHEGRAYTGGVSSEEDLQALRHSIENSWGTLFVVCGDTVHLSHQSVKDFLNHVFSDEGAHDYPRFGMRRADAHRVMASTCLTYLQFDDIQRRQVPKPPVNDDGMLEESELAATRQDYLQGFPFLHYSVESLGEHLRESQIQEENDVLGMEQFFAADSTPLQNWVRAYDLLKRWTHGKYSGFSTSTSLLFVSARMNLPWLADKATTWNKSIFSLPSAVAAPDTSGWSAIHIAADSEAVEMLVWLLHNGAIVDADTIGLLHPGRTALHLAATKRSDAGSRMVEELLKGGAKTTVYTRHGGNTPLHYAIDSRRVETVETLLEHYADVNATNGTGITPLHKACAIPGMENLVEALLKGGAEPDKKTTIGKGSAARGFAAFKASRTLVKTFHAINATQSALHIAVKVKDAERTVEVLLEHGADVNCRDSADRTPLHVAVVGMDREVMTKVLIERGADVNARDEEHRTPLLLFLQTVGAMASEMDAQGHAQLLSDLNGQASWERTVELLVTAGADPSAKGRHDISPISYATKAQLQWALEKMQVQPTGDEKPPQVVATEVAEGEPKHEHHHHHGHDHIGKGFLHGQATKWLPKRPKW